MQLTRTVAMGMRTAITAMRMQHMLTRSTTLAMQCMQGTQALTDRSLPKLAAAARQLLSSSGTSQQHHPQQEQQPVSLVAAKQQAAVYQLQPAGSLLQRTAAAALRMSAPLMRQ